MNKMMLKKQYMMYAPKKSGLPSEFQEVEYIQNTGTQYINSGVKGTQLASIDIDWFFATDNNIFGNENSAMPYGRIGFYIANGKVGVQAGGYASVNDANASLNNRYKVKVSFVYEDCWYILDNNEKMYPNISSWSTDDILSARTPLPIYILRKANSITKGGHRCYRFIMKDYDNNVIRDFIPCYRKSDNEIGLYDIVNNQFYTNQGSGTFLKGANV